MFSVKTISVTVAGVGILMLAACGGAGTGVSTTTEPDTAAAAAAAAAAPSVTIGVIVPTVGQPEQLTSGDYDNGNGYLDATGRLLVFQSNRDEHWQIYMMDLTDSSENRMVESDFNDENPVWATGRNAVLFVSDRDGGGDEWERDIYLHDLESGETVRLTDSPGDDWFPVAVDNAGFMFLSERDAAPETPIYQRPNSLYRSGYEGMIPERVTGVEDPSSPCLWTGGRILFRDGSGHLAVFSTSQDTTVEYLPGDYRVGGIAVDANNGLLALTIREDNGYSLFLYDPGTLTLQRLDTGSDDVRYPQFIGGGDAVIYTAAMEGKFQVFRLSLAQ